MIISHIIGGLGNQMFQYAAGRALSIHIKKSFIIDVQDFNQYELHNGYELEKIFNNEFRETLCKRLAHRHIEDISKNLYKLGD